MVFVDGGPLVVSEKWQNFQRGILILISFIYSKLIMYSFENH